MQYFWGQLEQSIRDTMIHLAERRALEQLGKIYGFEATRDEITDRAYGSGLHEAGYARRGTRLSMANVIEACFSDYNADFVTPGEMLIQSASHPNELIEYDATPSIVTNENAWAGRYIRTAYGRHLVLGTVLNTTRSGFVGNVQVLKLAPVKTDYTIPLPTLASGQVEVPTFKLPFALRETTPGPFDANNDQYPEFWTPGSPCLLEILLFSDVVSAVPPSYLITSATTTPVGMPYGSYLLDTTNVEGDQDNGPFPIYLLDGRAFALVEEQLNRLMVAGTHCIVIGEPAR